MSKRYSYVKFNLYPVPGLKSVYNLKTEKLYTDDLEFLIKEKVNFFDTIVDEDSISEKIGVNISTIFNFKNNKCNPVYFADTNERNIEYEKNYLNSIGVSHLRTAEVLRYNEISVYEKDRSRNSARDDLTFRNLDDSEHIRFYNLFRYTYDDKFGDSDISANYSFETEDEREEFPYIFDEVTHDEIESFTRDIYNNIISNNVILEKYLMHIILSSDYNNLSKIRDVLKSLNGNIKIDSISKLIEYTNDPKRYAIVSDFLYDQIKDVFLDNYIYDIFAFILCNRLYLYDHGENIKIEELSSSSSSSYNTYYLKILSRPILSSILTKDYYLKLSNDDISYIIIDRNDLGNCIWVYYNDSIKMYEYGPFNASLLSCFGESSIGRNYNNMLMMSIYRIYSSEYNKKYMETINIMNKKDMYGTLSFSELNKLCSSEDYIFKYSSYKVFECKSDYKIHSCFKNFNIVYNNCFFNKMDDFSDVDLYRVPSFPFTQINKRTVESIKHLLSFNKLDVKSSLKKDKLIESFISSIIDKYNKHIKYIEDYFNNKKFFMVNMNYLSTIKPFEVNIPDVSSNLSNSFIMFYVLSHTKNGILFNNNEEINDISQLELFKPLFLDTFAKLDGCYGTSTNFQNTTFVLYNKQ